jgi:hypothetical protein
MNTYTITYKKKDQELRTIQEKLKKKTIINNNLYTSTQKKHLTPKKPKKTQKTKWDTFAYYIPETRTITKLFNNRDIGIAFRTTNILKSHLKTREQIRDVYNQTGYAN